MIIVLWNKGNGIQRRFTGESSVLIEKGKSKDEVADLLEGIATLYRWMRKKAAGENLKPRKWLFYMKNRSGNACRVR